MECGITMPIWMYDRPSLLVAGRIVSLKSEVKSQQEVCEVEAQTHAVGHGYLFPESVEAEHTSGLVLIIMYCPDISGIDKCSPFEHPEEFGTILEAEVQAYVTALVYEVGYRISGVVTSRSQGAHSPALSLIKL